MTTEKTSLVLRACNADMTSRNNFKWPESGYVSCPDWSPSYQCGNGLHGWVDGHGDGDVCEYWEETSKWLVVKVNDDDIIELSGKVKFRCGEVVFCGDRKGATDYILANSDSAKESPIIGATVIVSDHKTAHTCYRGTSSAGNHGVAASGDNGTSESLRKGTSITGDGGFAKSGDGGVSSSRYSGTSVTGDYSIAVSREYGKAISGDYSNSISHDNGHSTSGRCGKSISGSTGTAISGTKGTSIAGAFGTAISGDYGTSISGRYGSARSGNYGSSMSGVEGSAASGYLGKINIEYKKNDRLYNKMGYIGEDGLEPNVLYELDSDNNFVKAE